MGGEAPDVAQMDVYKFRSTKTRIALLPKHWAQKRRYTQRQNEIRRGAPYDSDTSKTGIREDGSRSAIHLCQKKRSDIVKVYYHRGFQTGRFGATLKFDTSEWRPRRIRSNRYMPRAKFPRWISLLSRKS